MAVTQGRSAMEAAVTAVLAELRASGSGVVTLEVPTGHSALGFRVGVHGDTPQREPYPHVRVDAAGEMPDSTMGRNGKQVLIYCQIFDDHEGDKRILKIANVLVALMNPAGNYAAIVVSGYRTEGVEFDDIETNPDQDDNAGKKIRHKTIKFKLYLEESA
jgi:hypothetical protein